MRQMDTPPSRGRFPLCGVLLRSWPKIFWKASAGAGSGGSASHERSARLRGADIVRGAASPVTLLGALDRSLKATRPSKWRYLQPWLCAHSLQSRGQTRACVRRWFGSVCPYCSKTGCVRPAARLCARRRFESNRFYALRLSCHLCMRSRNSRPWASLASSYMCGANSQR